MEHELDKAVNMKLILCIFEQLLGQKINFHKSEIFALVKLNMRRRNIRIYSAVESDPFHSVTWNSNPLPLSS
jgi:hypothetical protein